MSNKSYSPVFDIVDSLFMKLGRLNARRLAEHDVCNNILFKRESQANTIYNSSMKSISLIKYNPLWMLIYGIIFVLIPLTITIDHNPPSTLPNGTHNTLPAAIFVGLNWGFPIFVSLALKMVFLRYKFLNNLDKDSLTQLSKIKAFRRDQFGFGVKDAYMTASRSRIIFMTLAITLLCYVITIFNLTSFSNPYFIVAVFQCVVTGIVISFMFSILFLAVTTIAHCDDTGTKEKKESKEEKHQMVPDAI